MADFMEINGNIGATLPEGYVIPSFQQVGACTAANARARP